MQSFSIVHSLLLGVANLLLSSGALDYKVSAPVGDIRGVIALTGNYVNYLGIPYGKLDEDNPFGTATPYPKFTTTFEAIYGETMCPQISEIFNVSVGQVDCLTLNIYVPTSARSNNKLPVMIFFYGGNFESGSAGQVIYGPKFLVRHDIILVIINYRLGPYGFMCLNKPENPNNQGLRDQLLALRWVKNNIASFNGDVNKITLFGESAGARSIDLHILSPQEILFHKVIMESGNSLIRNTIIEPDPNSPIKLAAQMGYQTNDVNEALKFLAKSKPTAVIDASVKAKLNFKPCVENKFDNVDIIVEDYPNNLKPNKAKNMPVLLGYNSMEQVARYLGKDPELAKHVDVIYDRLNEYFNFTEEELGNAVFEVRQFYFGNDTSENDMIWRYIDFDSDFTYNYAIERGIDKFLDVDVPKLYYYVFSYTGGRNIYKNQEGVIKGGASHFDEIGYLFDVIAYNLIILPNDQLIIDRMTTMWTNFAKYSNPTPASTLLLPVLWKPTTITDRYYMNIDTQMALKKNPFQERMEFWERFFEKYGSRQRAQ